MQAIPMSSLSCPSPHTLPSPCPCRYVVDPNVADKNPAATNHKLCTEELASLQGRYNAQAAAIEKIRQERLPGRR